MKNPFSRLPNRDTTFLEADELALRVQSAAAELRLPRHSPPPRFNGWCAPMCEAYVFLARDPRTAALATTGLKVRYHKFSTRWGDSHYWLATDAGVMDVNYGPGEDPRTSRCDYGAGREPTRTDGFRPWQEDERYPRNQSARKIMDLVWDRLDTHVDRP